MKKLLIFAALALVSCGESRYKNVDLNCTAKDINGGALIECPDGSSTIVMDGEAGESGIPGEDGKNSVIAVIDPCGDYQGDNEFDEVLLQLEDESFYAWFTGVGVVRLLPGNTYETTDAQKCRFRINSDNTYQEI